MGQQTRGQKSKAARNHGFDPFKLTRHASRSNTHSDGADGTAISFAVRKQRAVRRRPDLRRIRFCPWRICEQFTLHRSVSHPAAHTPHHHHTHPPSTRSIARGGPVLFVFLFICLSMVTVQQWSAIQWNCTPEHPLRPCRPCRCPSRPFVPFTVDCSPPMWPLATSCAALCSWQ